MRLRPVTFRYQKPFADGSNQIQYGFIAEEELTFTRTSWHAAPMGRLRQ
jgi:hypothetical protein